MNLCNQSTVKLNQLLDEGKSWQSCAELRTHVAQCPACQQLVQHHEELLRAVVELCEATAANQPTLDDSFANRAVLAAEFCDISPAPLARRSYRWTALLAVAATLLLAAWPAAMWWQTESSQREKLREETQTQLSSFKSAIDTAHSAEFETLFQATGRSLASLPTTVRRASFWPEGEQIGDSLRPMASSLGETIQALLRRLPVESSPLKTPNGDTGSYELIPPLAIG